MKTVSLLALTAATLCIAGCITERSARAHTGQEASPDIAKARSVISSLQPQLKMLISYTPAELQTHWRNETQDYYHSDVAPRIDNIAEYIKPSAMHWLHVDWVEPL